MTKERPILFRGDLVRAILEGRKTMTRRPLKIQPMDILPCGGDWNGKRWMAQLLPGKGSLFSCRYGAAGDRLWVRETWGLVWNETAERAEKYPVYRADDSQAPEDNWTPMPWRPSIHMPRWASRITLEITGVRVERVQEISCQDLEAEGYPQHPLGPIAHQRIAFSGSWNRTYPGSWDRNEFVWVIEFKRI